MSQIPSNPPDNISWEELLKNPPKEPWNPSVSENTKFIPSKSVVEALANFEKKLKEEVFKQERPNPKEAAVEEMINRLDEYKKQTGKTYTPLIQDEFCTVPNLPLWAYEQKSLNDRINEARKSLENDSKNSNLKEHKDIKPKTHGQEIGE